MYKVDHLLLFNVMNATRSYIHVRVKAALHTLLFTPPPPTSPQSYLTCLRNVFRFRHADGAEEAAIAPPDHVWIIHVPLK